MSSPEPDYFYSSGRSSYRQPDDALRTKKTRYESSKEMTYGVDPYPHGGYKPYGQKTDGRDQLIVSNLPIHASDQIVKDGLFHEFKKFGHVSIYLRGRGEGRTAAISYRNPDDTVKVKQYHERRGKFIVFDRPVHIDYENDFEHGSDRGFSPDTFNSVSPRRSMTKPSRSYQPKEDFMREQHFDDGKFRGRDRSDFRDNQRRFQYEDFRESGNVPVEDDPKASRTLFVGNLEKSVNANELRRIFEEFGHVEDVEIKRPAQPHGTTYAFVKFLDIDIAARAKAFVDGKYIGRNACKIGYGRSMPTTRLWVGGLGPWTNNDELTREFDRFGAIKFIDFQKGNNYAYVLYDSLDAARVAAREMHGYPLGGPGRRLKIDFASADKGRTSNQYEQFPDFERRDVPFERNSVGRGRGRNNWEQRGVRKFSGDREFQQRDNRKWFDHKNGPFRDKMGRGSHYNDREIHVERELRLSEGDKPSRRRGRSRSPLDDAPTRTAKRNESYRSHSRPSPVSQRGRSYSPDRKRDRNERTSPSPQRAKQNHTRSNEKEASASKKVSNDTDSVEKNTTSAKAESDVIKEEKTSKQENGSDNSSKAESIVDVAKRFAVAWRGAFALKTSAFPLRMHLIGGNPELADSLLRAVGQGKVLSISQRLRLDQPKLEEVSRRVSTAGASGHCILLALPISQSGWEDLDLDENFQQRHLRSLVVYLKQKQAAGVIPLPNNESTASGKDEGGILHAFPPCDYSHQQLLKVAPNLGPEPSKEDHLVIILVRGSG